MNYFNYFTEIEEEFVKRRGSHMLVSPLDWSLIETWKQRDIPLHIVLRGINSSFDSYDARKHRGRRVNSLLYCQQEVEAMFQEYVESRVGSNDAGQAAESNGNGSGESKSAQTQFSPATLIDYLADHRESINRLKNKHAMQPALVEVFDRALVRLDQIISDLGTSGRVSPEDLETDLTMIEEIMLEGIRAVVGDEKLAELKKEGNQQLRTYKQTMEREIYDQTLANFISRRLREIYSVPRLSLFYL